MTTDNVRLHFDDGDLVVPLEEYMRMRREAMQRYTRMLKQRGDALEIELLGKEIELLSKEIAEIDERIRLRIDGEKGRTNRCVKNADRNATIKADRARFDGALGLYGQITDLPDLLAEFNVPADKRASFKQRNINAAIGKKHGLTATQVGNILRAKKIG